MKSSQVPALVRWGGRWTWAREWVAAVGMMGVAVVLGFGVGTRAAEVSKDRSWAFEPVRRPALPAVRDAAWCATPVDRFVLARLEEHQWHPAPEADRRTLLRRVCFDLTGLPPTPAELEAFLADSSPDAYARVIERLLQSPHYGERWGRHWLDVARYADNKGYVFFEEKTYPWAWAYRDYVVRAFNDDKPFDRFITEQLAADQLGDVVDTRDRAALGFLTVGDHFSNNVHDILDDRIDVVTRGLLGLTVGCARCHDHKYDPVSQADYYALYGVFRSSAEPMVPPLLEAPARTATYECFEWELGERERRLREYVEAKHRAIVEDARTRIGEYLRVVYAQRDQPTTESFMLIADKGDANPTVVARWRRHIERAGPEDAVWAPWHAFARLAETNFAAQSASVRDGLLAPGTGLNARVRTAFTGAAPASMAEVIERYSRLLNTVEAEWRRLAVVAGKNAPAPSRMPDDADEALRRVLHGPDAPPDVPLQMDWGFLSLLPDRASQGEFQVLLRELEQWLMTGPEAPPRAMVLEDLPVVHQSRVFERGNPNRLGRAVERRFLRAIDARPLERGSGRRDLAEAIVDPRNPFTARVMVNRVWMHHFGAGLVSTPGDFGRRSDPPTHPELLDWLADAFVRGGWRVKDLHRWIVLSATYRQASSVPDAGTNPAVEADPDNRRLWRMNRRRHDFETQRDALLAVSGRLDPRLGGPAEAAGRTSVRRTVYSFVDRLDVPPVMTTFDFPSPSSSCPQRSQTMVASQALYLMNNEFIAECAAAMVRRPEIETAGVRNEKVERLTRLAFGRGPTAAEVARAGAFLGAHPDVARWELFAQALLMANEFVFVD